MTIFLAIGLNIVQRSKQATSWRPLGLSVFSKLKQHNNRLETRVINRATSLFFCQEVICLSKAQIRIISVVKMAGPDRPTGLKLLDPLTYTGLKIVIFAYDRQITPG
jgi:hypothetical protein